ncbi:MAG: hypothetical protein ABIT58_02830 [Ferruginibacter sp.]
MEKLFRLIFLVVIISSCSKNNGNNGGSSAVLLPDTLSAGWTKITSLPVENFRDILFTDTQNGFAVSDNGIYKSSNGGTDWSKINSSSNLVAIGAANSNRACFVNNDFPVYVTQDGGSNFSQASYVYPGGGTVGFYDCFFTDANNCYFSSRQYAWKSIDGGLTLDTLFRFSTVSSTSSLFFLNNTEGWLLRQDGLYKTLDGGDSWIVDTSLTNAYGSIDFPDSNIGYFSFYGTVNKTTDGGVTWVPVYQTGTDSFTSIDFVNADEGYIGFNNKICKTIDGGNTWTVVVALGNEIVSKIFFSDAGHGWASTSDGVVVKFVQ